MIMEIFYQGEKYNAYPSDHFAVEEAVCINGIIGRIDHISDLSAWLVDEQNKCHEFKYADIETVYILYRNGIIGADGKRKRIFPHNWKGAKNKQLKQNINIAIKHVFTAKDKDLTRSQIAKELGVELRDIQASTVSHTYDVSNILEVGSVYEYSTYEITTK